MAEGNYSIEIPVTADLTQFRAQLRAELEAVGKGIAVPVRGGRDPGGQGAATFPTVAAAEQAAVQRAMEQAQSRSSGGYYGGALSTAMGGGPGGGSLRIGADTNEAQIAFRRVRGIYDEVKRHIESNPIRITVDTVGAQAGIAAARAGGGGAAAAAAAVAASGGHSVEILTGLQRSPNPLLYGTPGAAAAVAASVGISPAATQAFVAQAAGVPQSVADLRASLFDSVQQRLAAVESQALPGSIVLETAESMKRKREEQLRKSGGVLGGIRYGRAIAGALAVTEISSAIQAWRTGESQARLADTPEDAQLARAQGFDRRFSGLIGGIISLPANLLNTPGAPQRELIEAQEAVAYRRMRDDARMKTYGVGESSAYRRGYYAGGPHLAEIAQIRARNKNQLDEIDRQMVEQQARLDARTPVVRQYAYTASGALVETTKTGGELVLQGEARQTLQESLNANSRLYGDSVQQKKFDLEQAERKRWIMLRAIDRQPSILSAAIEGRPRLAQERGFIADIAGQEDLVRDDPVLLKRQRAQNLLSIEARRTEIITERFERRDDLEEQTRQSRFRQAGPRYAVDAITNTITSATNRAARQLERDSDPENAVRRRNLGVQQLREASADYFRSIEFEEVRGGSFASGRGNPFARADRKFKDAEDKIGKSKDGGPGDEDKSLKILEEIDKSLKQMLTKHFRAKAG